MALYIFERITQQTGSMGWVAVKCECGSLSVVNPETPLGSNELKYTCLSCGLTQTLKNVVVTDLTEVTHENKEDLLKKLCETYRTNRSNFRWAKEAESAMRGDISPHKLLSVSENMSKR